MSAHKNELNAWISLLQKKRMLPEAKVKSLCVKVVEVLRKEANMISVSSPVRVCGDIHGQFEDLRHLFRQGGPVGSGKYLFLGDYVDRGSYSVECVCLLLAYKVKYPDRMFLLRGNHECRSVTQVYGFHDECMRKYGGPAVWKYLTDAFDFLPLCALVDSRILCMHGGLTVNAIALDEISKLDRTREVPHRGLMTDLLWSDPDEETEKWKESSRGAGIIFGPGVTKLFTHTNDLSHICRAHQVVSQGYEWSQEGLCLTLFSAANYCSTCRNLGAVMKLTATNAAPMFEQYEGRSYPPPADAGDSASDLTTFNAVFQEFNPSEQ